MLVNWKFEIIIPFMKFCFDSRFMLDRNKVDI
jgi:hypothetical protein